jgi:two-component system, NtrC family, response regulator PilR
MRPWTKAAVLIVDDEPDLCELLSITLQRMNLGSRTATTSRPRSALLKTENFDLCLTDMQLPDGDGLELVEWMQQYSPSVPVAVITAHGNMEIAVRALKLGAFDFVSKPLDLVGLRKLVAAPSSCRWPDEATPTLFGPRCSANRCHAAAARHDRARRAQPGPGAHSGESGTGKELVAKLIHGSGRAATAVRAGQLRRDPHRADGERAVRPQARQLQRRGQRQAGLIQSAEGGTLFLDEIADLPLHMQVKLLRVIQEKGSARSASSRNADRRAHPVGDSQEPRAAGAEGKFREDLFYRVNVIELRVPALRERPEDVPDLAEAILRRLGRRMNTEPPTLAPDAVTALCNYYFPGNVRELENILERAVTARRDSQGAGKAPLQQDGRGQGAGNVVPDAALPHQEARNRIMTAHGSG